jgi:pseudouridylate synthase
MEIQYSAEVGQARVEGRPLVALETSVVVQGLAFPHNLEAARACEEAVRRAGAVPAAIALLEGRVHIGLEAAQLRALAAGGQGLHKVGSRDLAWAMVQRATGGTTVSATCELAAKVGIAVFSTGGIGGVHRGVVDHFDISQDLWALGRFPVAVVCAGAKSVLDLPRTLEVLETLAVPVVGVGTDTFPSFFSHSSGLALEQRVDGAEQAAALARFRLSVLGQGGMLFCVPPPPHSALPNAEVELHLAHALRLAAQQNVKGKALTPFLLSQLVRSTGGRTLRTNIDLLVNNAAFAGALAVALGQGPVGSGA